MVIAIIQARMDSSRLPNKVLMDIHGKPMLHHVIKQTLASKHITKIIIATSIYNEDNAIEEFCKKNEIICFRGSKDDVLDRYYQCAKKFRCDPVVRISADSPLIDPKVIDRVVSKFLKNSYDYVSNNIEKDSNKWKNSTCNFPVGTAVEVSSFKALKKAWTEAKKPSEREHVFPYIQFNPKVFRISSIKNRQNLSYIRCTVDRRNDLLFVRKIFELLSNKKIIFMKDIKKIVKINPALLQINCKIPFDEGWKISVKKDKKNR